MNRVLQAARGLRRRGAGAQLPTEPLSRKFGFDRGQPIDRFYIERFLGRESNRIRGRVLEIGDDGYTRRFGSGVERSDVLHADEGAPGATLVGDLATGEGVPEGVFDCLVLTQTLPFIFDLRPAVANCHRALAPGGTVLATVPGISQISRFDMDHWGDYWRFTDLSARRLFAGPFGEEALNVEAHGSVGAACAFLQGMAVEDVDPARLEQDDPDYQLIITVVARRES